MAFPKMYPKDKNISLTFVNYNYAFNNFYENYKNQCLAISEKTMLHEIADVRKIISTFIYEYDYTIRENKQRIAYRESLKDIKAQMDQDEEIARILLKDPNVKTKMEYRRKYYKYFLMYLNVLRAFVTELTSSFMPNTNIQKKLIKFSNNHAFFEKFTQHKKIVLDQLSDFSMAEFAKSYNKLLTFYYAYGLFINNEAKLIIDRFFTLILSIYLTKENLQLLQNPDLSPTQKKVLHTNEVILHNALLYCNSKMNQSFSNYDVLPKLQTKVYVDNTLI